MEGNGECCENCNKPLANVAIIENSDKKQFIVGMDCASTLSGIKNSDSFERAENNFKEAKAIRAKVNKYLKQFENAEIEVTNFYSGKISIIVSVDGRCYVNEAINKDFFFTYMSDYQSKISNPEKNGYNFVGSENDLKEFDFSQLSCRTGFEPIKINLYGFDFILCYDKIQAPAGNYNKMFDLKMYENGKLLKTRNFYMNRDIKSNIIWDINKVLFERFNTPTKK